MVHCQLSLKPAFGVVQHHFCVFFSPSSCQFFVVLISDVSFSMTLIIIIKENGIKAQSLHGFRLSGGHVNGLFRDSFSGFGGRDSFRKEPLFHTQTQMTP